MNQLFTYHDNLIYTNRKKPFKPFVKDDFCQNLDSKQYIIYIIDNVSRRSFKTLIRDIGNL